VSNKPTTENRKPTTENPDQFKSIDEALMGLALGEAQKALALGEVPVGAVLTGADGEIWGRGHNRVIVLSDPSAHAEIMALREAASKVQNYRLPGCTIYVTIEPCIMCVGALLQARIKRLVFGATDPKGGACLSLYQLSNDPRLNHRIEVVPSIRQEECRTLMQDFFRARRSARSSEL
jgi:tRNA(adenine34) deaminase